MIHGKTKIELYNPNTKIKNIIKSENTFQSNVLADYFRHYGEEDCNPFRAGNYDNNNLWKSALGGIFLLKNPEEVGTKFMSLGNKMVGNGSYGLSNSGNPNELGSYNLQESSESGTEITQVYDFATNQANGNIACVCLTSRVGGYIGYGNSSMQYHASRSYSFASLQSQRGVTNFSKASAYGNWIIDVSGNYSDGKIKITKTRRSLITGSVFNGFSKTVEFDLSEVGDGYGISGNTYEFGCLKLYDIGNGIFRFVPYFNTSKMIDVNGTVYYYEYDAENDTLTQKSFINTSNRRICISGYGGNEVVGVIFTKNYAFVGNDYIARYLEVFDLNTSEHLDSIDARLAGGSANDFRREKIYVLDDGWMCFEVQTQGTAGNFPEFMYDVVNQTAYPVNGNVIMVGSNAGGLVNNPSLGSGVLGKLSYEPRGNGQGIIHNPLYLATINNLDSYVTKTANQTMKVTYTLTEE